MDLSTIIGLVGWLAMLGISIVSGGAGIMDYIDPASVACTVGGSTFALILSCSFKDFFQLLKVMGRTFRIPHFKEKEIIAKLVEFAEKARREGILSLEEIINDLDDEFMKQGLRLVVDGTDADQIRNLMDNELNQVTERHTKWFKLLDAWAKLAPGFGMLGTVLGLIGMLRNMEDKSRIGPLMAVALVTTFYGAIMANALFTPMLQKLQAHHEMEAMVKEMIVEGVLAIQAGDNPRVLTLKLMSYLDPIAKKTVAAELLKDE